MRLERRPWGAWLNLPLCRCLGAWDAIEMRDWDGREPTWEQQSNVDDDLLRIVSYGEGCPGEFGGSWLEEDGGYGVTFTGSLDTHIRSLEEQLVYPERLRARQTAHSLRELQAVCDQIQHERFPLDRNQDSLGSALIRLSADQRRGLVRIAVLTNRPEVAAELRDQFGTMIEIELSNENNTLA
jgi:hypothetical protein